MLNIPPCPIKQEVHSGVSSIGSLYVSPPPTASRPNTELPSDRQSTSSSLDLTVNWSRTLVECRADDRTVFECLLLTMSEIGIPKVLFEEYLPILGPAHGLGCLGVFQAL